MAQRTLYDVLGVARDADAVALKRRFHALSRKHHPDKQQQQQQQQQRGDEKGGHESGEKGTSGCDRESSHAGNAEDFIELMKAWTILSKPEARATYDATLAQEETKQDLPFHDEVLLEDMTFDEDDEVHFMECRCGGEYVLEKDQTCTSVRGATWIIPCSTCTLALKVVRGSCPSPELAP